MALSTGIVRPPVASLPGPVSITIPAARSFVRIVRLVGAALGTDAGFSYDEVDDVRLAVDELCLALITEGRGGSLVVQFDIGDGEMTFTGRGDFTGQGT